MRFIWHRRLATANFTDGNELVRVAECKFLGLILHESLSWKMYVNYFMSKIGKRIGILGRTRKNKLVCILLL